MRNSILTLLDDHLGACCPCGSRYESLCPSQTRHFNSLSSVLRPADLLNSFGVAEGEGLVCGFDCGAICNADSAVSAGR